jgi:hypothetical protein
MVAVQAESMVARTYVHRRVIPREISRVLVLDLLWPTERCLGTAQDKYALDNAFALIEGHPGNLLLNWGNIEPKVTIP